MSVCPASLHRRSCCIGPMILTLPVPACEPSCLQRHLGTSFSSPAARPNGEPSGEVRKMKRALTTAGLTGFDFQCASQQI
ncbi:hypothetical protein RHECNPAF_3500050 [Rhizobium etli CNPAF512]|nr:hypothetical protein RHECNPAF_3500050 [Rhizobium etli CNPAF512]